MKKLFELFGIRKQDEMEKSIRLKSIQLAWMFTVIFLVAWGLYEGYTARINHESVNFLPLTLLVSQNFVLIFAQLFFRARMAKGGGEEKESLLGKIVPIIAVIGIAAVILSVVTYFIMR
jgi:hypothetical protein